MNDKISKLTLGKAYLDRVKFLFKKTAVKKCLNGDLKPKLTSNPLLKWPRNFNCVCGSGKKFKKCCLNGLARAITIKDAIELNKKLELYKV